MTAIQVSGLSKSFGGFRALKNVSFSVADGERRAIIGPNGAGKTTLFNAIAGQTRPTQGRVKIGAVETTGAPPHIMWRHGLTRTFQRNQLFPSVSVRDNVRLAAIAMHGIGGRLFSSLGRFPAVDESVTDILGRVHLTDRQDAIVRDLAYGEQRQLELALALVRRPKILMLDEPTAGMSPAETQAMIALLGGLPRDVTLLIVEHDMDVFFAIADIVTVLHLGEVLTEGEPRMIQSDPRVVNVYLGRHAEDAS
jgi:branched-chain amino acid transport system ATP-binding protein